MKCLSVVGFCSLHYYYIVCHRQRSIAYRSNGGFRYQRPITISWQRKITSEYKNKLYLLRLDFLGRRRNFEIAVTIANANTIQKTNQNGKYEAPILFKPYVIYL